MEQNNLQRTIGLVSATSIGLGAMLGAGIFVFPGIAGGYAGPAATISFFIGGIIALLVAACTAELSTAMPQSGGGYFFISRSFGHFWGTLVGIAQWIGLVFACAFYLISFGEYTITFLEELNVEWNRGTQLFSLSFTLLLLVVNIIGTKKVGQFQNLMVISLTVILVMIFTYGLIDTFGLEDKSTAFSGFTPKGTKPIFTTAALIFTSYLGFVQIANIGAEIKNPNKNLPRALIGSVLIAMVLYLFIMFVCSSILNSGELKEFGETATIEVARSMLGKWGALIVLFAGLLAALSSANASMISSSRSIFALSKDTLISKRASTINKRFGTPHIALVLVAVPIVLMLFRSKLELFAEVASFLHLIIYMGICCSLFKFRMTRPHWYIPTFRIPAAKIIAGVGAISCLALVFFMQKESILVGAGIIALTGLYHFFFVRKKGIQLSVPHPPHIDTALSTPRILIPVNITEEKKDVPDAIMTALPISSLLILGYKEIPEQADAEKSEEEYRKSGDRKLDNIVRKIEKTNIDYTQKLVFSNNAANSIKDAIEEEELRLILTLKPLSNLNRILIPIYDLRQIDVEIATIIHGLHRKGLIKILVLLFEEKDGEATNEISLKQAIDNQLSLVGVNVDHYEVYRRKETSAQDVLKKVAKKTDLVVWPEADPSSREVFLKIIREKESERITSPVMMILKQEK